MNRMLVVGATVLGMAAAGIVAGDHLPGFGMSAAFAKVQTEQNWASGAQPKQERQVLAALRAPENSTTAALRTPENATTAALRSEQNATTAALRTEENATTA